MLREPPVGDGLFQDFQRELESLDTFRDQFRSFYNFAGLDRADPDVQRIIEALAFFSARTRREAERALVRHERRALEQLFPYLLSPMPSMAMLLVEGTRSISDARTIPAGTEVLVTASPTAGGPAGELTYRTLRPLRVRPVEIDPGSVELVRQGDSGWQLSLSVSSGAPQIDPLDQLELHVNPQGDLVAALRLYDALRRSLRGVSYEFVGTRVENTTNRVVFAAPPDAPEVDPFANPIEGFRRFLHFPLAALGLRIPIARSPAEWTSLRLRFHLDPRWPAGLAVGPRALVLHAVPMINLVRAPAEPIAADGTRARAEVSHPDPSGGWRARDLLAVYRTTPEGAVPLPPESLAREGESYGVETAGAGLDRQLWLDLQLPSAFDQPTTVLAEAEWFQPAAARLFEGDLRAVPASRHIERVRWQLARPLQPSADSPLAERRDRLERLLDMSARGEPTAADLTFLLDVLGAAGNELFSRVVRAIDALEAADGPDARSPTGQKRVYLLRVRRLPPALRPAADLLFARVPALLAIWYDQPAVKLRVSIEGDDEPVEHVHSIEEATGGR